MEELRQKMRELLTETKEYYEVDPVKRRGIYTIAGSTKQKCVYANGCGGKCAIGRKLAPRELVYLKKQNSLNADFESIMKDVQVEPDSLKMEALLPYPFSFLRKLQEFHDTKEHWNANGITSSGQRFYMSLMFEISDGYYDRQHTLSQRIERFYTD